MVNNNTQQKTTSNTNSLTESNIYLKKSELPKNISSFKNDVGYISSSALSSWMKEHSYISKNEINALIKKANLVVVDTVNKITDDDAISRLNQDIIDIKGEIVAIKDRLIGVETNTISADKEYLFATKDEIPTKVSQLVNDKHYLTSHQSLSEYVKKSDLPDVSNFATKDEIPNLNNIATKEWVENKHYLTSHQSLSAYAKKSDLPDVSNFVTEQWINEQGFLTELQSLSDFAKKSDLTNFVTSSALSAYAKKNSVYDKNYIDTNILSKQDAEVEYLSKQDAENEYLSISDARKEYMKIEDYIGIKDASVINKDYDTKTLEELEHDLQYLKNGFYVVHYNDIVVIKDHQILRLFKDGAPQTTLEWIEEE